MIRLTSRRTLWIAPSARRKIEPEAMTIRLWLRSCSSQFKRRCEPVGQDLARRRYRDIDLGDDEVDAVEGEAAGQQRQQARACLDADRFAGEYARRAG